ncbi:unnamed protein product, partial [Strongylus vulgaris]
MAQRFKAYENSRESSIRILDGRFVNVTDEIARNVNQTVIVREVGTKDRRLTAMMLKTPKDNMDTAKWKIDKETLKMDTSTTTMISKLRLLFKASSLLTDDIEEIFISGAVERKASANVLVIGLGGGYMSSYLHHNYPKLDITSLEIDVQMLNISIEWFDLKMDEMHWVIIIDGVNFVQHAVQD